MINYSELSEQELKLELHLAYFAGIFDGEGWVSITRTRPYGRHVTPRYSLYIGVANTYLPVLEAMKLLFGGSLGKTAKVNLQCYAWRLTSHNAVRFLEALLPYLRIKRMQAEIGIEYMSVVSDGRGRFTRLTDEELAVREVFRLRLASSRGG